MSMLLNSIYCVAGLSHGLDCYLLSTVSYKWGPGQSYSCTTITQVWYKWNNTRVLYCILYCKPFIDKWPELIYVKEFFRWTGLKDYRSFYLGSCWLWRPRRWSVSAVVSSRWRSGMVNHLTPALWFTPEQDQRNATTTSTGESLILEIRFHNKFLRCSSKNCQRGHFHGYTIAENKDHPEMIYVYEDDCLESKYLVTSRETW